MLPVNRTIASLLILALVAAAPAWAQFSKPELAVKYRKSALFLMGNHMQRIKAELDVSKPDLAVVRSSAALLDQLKALPYDAFLPGTGDIEDSAAKPEVWTDAERFKKLAAQMQDRVAELDAAARAGDVPAIRKAFEETGKACKSCHDDFRRKK
jgi:cytochrome c556